MIIGYYPSIPQNTFVFRKNPHIDTLGKVYAHIYQNII